LTIPYARTALLTLCCLSLVACSGGGSNSRIDYKEAKTLPALDVPPELGEPIDSGVENIPELGPTGASANGSRILPEAEGIRIARDGSSRWLVLDATADELWPKLRQFWASLGLEVRRDEPAIGIMETQWAENRADAPGGFLTGLVKSVFKNAYSADTRDKYRIRLEPRDEGQIELFLTHYGLKEVVAAQTDEIVETAWQVRPSDPELANEILNRLILYLGGSEQTAKAVLAQAPESTTPRARIEGEMLVLEEGFSRAWRLTGLALDRIGLVVQDRNRSEGIYYVSRVDLLADAGEKEESWFGSLFADETAQTEQDMQWQVKLEGGETRSRIHILDEQGTQVPAKNSLPILRRLQESLR